MKFSWKRGNKIVGSIDIELAKDKLTEEEIKQVLPEMEALCRKLEEVHFVKSLSEYAKM